MARSSKVDLRQMYVFVFDNVYIPRIWLALFLIVIAILGLVSFSSFPDYCDHYHWSERVNHTYVQYNSTVYPPATRLKYLFLFDAVIFLWFGVLNLIIFLFVLVDSEMGRDYSFPIKCIDYSTFGVLFVLYVPIGTWMTVSTSHVSQACVDPIIVSFVLSWLFNMFATLLGFVPLIIAVFLCCVVIGVIFFMFTLPCYFGYLTLNSLQKNKVYTELNGDV